MAWLLVPFQQAPADCLVCKGKLAVVAVIPCLWACLALQHTPPSCRARWAAGECWLTVKETERSLHNQRCTRLT